MSAPLLEVSGVSVRFGGLAALTDVDLQVERHGIVGLIGPNGAGKTTLLNVISGLQGAQSGSIRFAEREIAGMPAYRRAKLGIRRSFQNLGLMQSETVGSNLLAAQHVEAGYNGLDMMVRPLRWLRRERELRERAVAATAPFKLDRLHDTPVADLSFGAARFVELSAVLVQRPPLLLLDEPTTGLDLAETARLLTALRTAREDGTTILLIAHDVQFVMELCDFVYVLAEGRVIATGGPEEVQSSPPVIEAYLGRTA
jgi:branched-chain amino acid transport system ATP-binding protein